MNNTTLSGNRRQKLTVIMLIAVFTTPVVGAWIIYFFTGFVSDGEGSSHGRLILPPGHVQNLRPAEALSGTGDYQLHGKWTLLYLASGQCDGLCEQALDIMQGVRVALGKESGRIQPVLGINELNLTEELKSRLSTRRILTLNQVEIEAPEAPAGLATENIFAGDALYVVDPNGNLMMYYPSESTLPGVIRDMKRLLRNSRIG